MSTNIQGGPAPSDEERAQRRTDLISRVRVDLWKAVWEASQVLSYDDIRKLRGEHDQRDSGGRAVTSSPSTPWIGYAVVVSMLLGGLLALLFGKGWVLIAIPLVGAAVLVDELRGRR